MELQYSAFISPLPTLLGFFFLYCEIEESQEKARNKPISYSYILFANSNIQLWANCLLQDKKFN